MVLLLCQADYNAFFAEEEGGGCMHGTEFGSDLLTPPEN
jgi:hypothetical protein